MPAICRRRRRWRQLSPTFGTITVIHLSNTTVTYIVGAGCALIAVAAFFTLVVIPSVTAYRRPLERVAAVVLSLYVLAAFVGAGVLLGAVIILEWPRVF